MAVASRWPQRFSPAAFISFSISRSVRYSRGRADRPTVTFTAIGACISGAVFSIVSRSGGLETVTVLSRSVTVLIGLQTVTEGKERTSGVKSQVPGEPRVMSALPPERHQHHLPRYAPAEIFLAQAIAFPWQWLSAPRPRCNDRLLAVSSIRSNGRGASTFSRIR